MRERVIKGINSIEKIREKEVRKKERKDGKLMNSTTHFQNLLGKWSFITVKVQ